MAANEIAERLRAAAWVECGAVDGGEGVDTFDVDQLRFRSLVGFQNRIWTTVNAAEVPVMILKLDDVCSRRECAVFAFRHGTVEPVPDSRSSYPVLSSAQANYANVFVQPCHLGWFGPDLSNPLWYPFGLAPGPYTVPGDFDLDLFNAIAVILPIAGGVAQSGDFSVLVLKHPPIEGATVIEAVLPAS